MLKAFLQRRRLRKTFERYLSPEIARQLAEGACAASGPERVERIIEFAFVALTAPDGPSYSERAGIVSEIADQHEGVIQSLTPIVVIAFDMLHPAPAGARLRFVNAVQSRFPGDTAIVHGSISAWVGSFGSDRLMQFGFWWPGAVDALRQLATLSAGEALEI